MKRNNLTFTQAIEGYKLAAEARGLSENTLIDYENSFRKFQGFLGDKDPVFTDIDSDLVEEFLASRTEVTKKTRLNYHTALAALWTWAVKDGLTSEHVIHQVARPRAEKRVIEPFSESDVKAMMNGVQFSAPYSRPGKKTCQHSRPEADRDKAILLMLIDTGMRASELCDLKIFNVDVKNRHIKVFGKGSKERILPFSARTGQALWRYLTSRKDERTDSPLFVTKYGHALDRDQLLKMVSRLGVRCGVQDVHPHRFRHTFAIMYLRNGGDPFTLQMMLGHETMEMVRYYMKLAQADLDGGHRRASPVENWRL